MPNLTPAAFRIAVFVADLDDRPQGRAALAIAHALQSAGHPVDLVAPMGGGALRASLDPAVGQIDLAKRHAATSPLALARVLAERRPTVLAAPAGLAWIARLAVRLARHGSKTGVAVLSEGGALDDHLAAIRAAAPRSG